MKSCSLIGIFLLIFSLCALTLADSAEAARMGGGKSFGSRPSMSQPTRAPGMQSQQPRNQAGPTAAAPSRGMFGGMGGLFGGLLAGTLLGSLLSGNGFGGGGGFMDIILFAILAFIAWKLFMRFRSRQAAEPTPASTTGIPFGRNNSFEQPMARNASSDSGWGDLQSDPQPAAQPRVDIPADFDSEEFLRGAKMVFNRMQKSWDKRDLADIAQFATPAVMQILQQQNAEEPTPSHTEIITVNAQLVGVEDEGNTRRAQVYFDVLMRENASSAAPESVREIWHFTRQGQSGNWKLDGIQQVE